MAKLIKGMNVTLLIPKKVGVDAFNRSILEDVPVVVEDVLVCPVDSGEIINEMQLSGKKAVYELCIPKGDTHDWTDVKVDFFGRQWKTIGFPRQWIEENVPLRWNRKVKVEAYE